MPKLVKTYLDDILDKLKNPNLTIEEQNILKDKLGNHIKNLELTKSLIK